MEKLRPVTSYYINLGCDPEFFLRHNGEIIGAEKVIPKQGLSSVGGNSKVIIDGVQAELNPMPSTCRESLAYHIGSSFVALQNRMTKDGGALTADFSRTVVIAKDKLMELNEESRKFGCAPSQSIHKNPLKITDINPEEYLTRAAGGHIHLGFSPADTTNTNINVALKKKCAQTVELLDIIVGNTSVLIDRDEGNIERRKLYGRAGEYRLPKHGIEYRTLSNYWLTSYQLMSFAFGMARLAVDIMVTDSANNNTILYDAFVSKVDPDAIQYAINENDWDTAVDNFHAIEDTLMEAIPIDDKRYPINRGNVIDFKHFVNTIADKGLGYWFKEDPMTHWVKISQKGCGAGFNDYLYKTVRNDRLAKEKAA